MGGRGEAEAKKRREKGKPKKEKQQQLGGGGPKGQRSVDPPKMSFWGGFWPHFSSRLTPGWGHKVPEGIEA